MNIRQTPETPASILIVDDLPDNLRLLSDILQDQGYLVRLLRQGEMVLPSVLSLPPELILLDIMMPGMDGYEVCQQLKTDERTRDIPIIFLSALEDIADKVKAFAVGGVDYITKPFQAEEVLARVQTHLTLQQYRAHLAELVDERTRELKHANEQLQTALAEIRQLKDQLQVENLYFREEIKLEHNFDEILGQSPLLAYTLFKVAQVAATDTPILILGETGVGKELIARAIHHASLRKDRPLVKVNCAALPAHLIESELFGHERGSFTGAIAKRIGRFELADGATLFLDEIGELPLELQPKLLRVIQEGEFERLGNSRTLKVDVRLLAATNRNLEAEVHAKKFRQDLYYRLAVYPLTIPPLRERRDDIPLLVQAFVRKFSKKHGKLIETIPQATLTALQQYAWPGNVRELENVIERAVITTPDHILRVELPETPIAITEPTKTLETVERDYITQVLKSTNWRIEGPKGAALILGLHPNTLRFRMQKLNIKRS
ncbi:transcriptional regulator, NifA subfamily, Fis Family [Candidatus Vecturithrix granuli]|uniref:Transcriptional regulator, NifA subfamily, Fis Family n=1 Tax=Vecturithrix granuli TaxID=1499967 RepID=A0A081C7R4_VECG1|nr:transcriptional regulator, NifA subfamily, Fis Family [Candidatus Vecturithrix granuli]